MTKEVKTGAKDARRTPAPFADKPPLVWRMYQMLLDKLESEVGAIEVQEKRTSLHLTNGTAFAGVHPKKNWLDLTIRLDKQLTGARVRSSEHVSRSRWHNEVRLVSEKDVNRQLISWLAAAYALCKR